MRTLSFFSILLMAALVYGCNGEPDSRQQEAAVNGEGIHIEGAWARPASEGRMSAAYFLITNFGDTADTLTAVRSDVAEMVEIHESYEEDGIAGMRDISEIEIPAGATVRLEQGGLHVMLIRVTEALSDGDTVELELEFAADGARTIEVPVRL